MFIVEMISIKITSVKKRKNSSSMSCLCEMRDRINIILIAGMILHALARRRVRRCTCDAARRTGFVSSRYPFSSEETLALSVHQASLAPFDQWMLPPGAGSSTIDFFLPPFFLGLGRIFGTGKGNPIGSPGKLRGTSTVVISHLPI